MPPATDITAPSVTDCRSSRPRLAPRAIRSTNSRLRDPARAITKFARFAQTMSSTNPTAACRTQIGRLAFPTIASCNARNWRVWSTECRGRFVGTWSVVPTRSPQFSRNARSSVCAHLSGDAIFQSRNDVEDMGLALPGHIRMKPEGQPDLGVVIHDVGPGWHNANDFVGAALDFQLLSNERSLSKCCSPQFVGENCDRWR